MHVPYSRSLPHGTPLLLVVLQLLILLVLLLLVQVLLVLVLQQIAVPYISIKWNEIKRMYTFSLVPFSIIEFLTTPQLLQLLPISPPVSPPGIFSHRFSTSRFSKGVAAHGFKGDSPAPIFFPPMGTPRSHRRIYGSLCCQHKQRTTKGKSPKFTIHLHCLIRLIPPK